MTRTHYLPTIGVAILLFACSPGTTASDSDVATDAVPDTGPTQDLAGDAPQVDPPDGISKKPALVLTISPPGGCGWFAGLEAQIGVSTQLLNVPEEQIEIPAYQLFFLPEIGDEVLLDEAAAPLETLQFKTDELPGGLETYGGKTTTVALKVKAISNVEVDGALLTAEEKVDIVVDLVPPAVTIVAPESGPVITPYVDELPYTYHVQEDGSGLVTHQVYLGQTAMSPVTQSQEDQDGALKVVGLLDTSKMGTQNTAYRVEATDCAANVGSAEVQVALVAAPNFLAPPVVQCDDIAAEMTYTPSRKLRLGPGDKDDSGEDFLVAGESGIYVAWNNEDSTFQPLTRVAEVYKGVDARFVEMTGDDVPDLVALFKSGENYIVTLYRQDTNGAGDGLRTFAEAEFQTVGSKPFTLETADINLDGFADLLVGHLTEEQSVAVVRHRGADAIGTETLLDDSYFLTGVGNISDMKLADLNDDNAPDIVTTRGGAGILSAYLNTGDGDYLMAHNTLLMGQDAPLLGLGDFVEDGVPDVLVYIYDAGAVHSMEGLGNGYFDPFDAATVGCSADPQKAVATLVSDEWDRPQVQKAGKVVIVGDNTTALEVADFNLDGHLDMVLPEKSRGILQLFWGLGDGTFAESYFLNVYPMPFSLAVGHLNDDDIPDMGVLQVGSCEISLLLSRNDGGCGQPGNGVEVECPHGATSVEDTGVPLWSTSAELPTPVHPDWKKENRLIPIRLVGGDLDENGHTDTAVVTGPAFSVYTPCEKLEDMAHKAHSVVSYMGIGKPDLSVDMYRSMLGDHFQYGIADVAVEDFNQDGLLDIAVSSPKGNSSCTDQEDRYINLDILAGGYALGFADQPFWEESECMPFPAYYPDSGAFLSTRGWGFDSHPSAIGAADLNGDGLPDLISGVKGTPPGQTNCPVLDEISVHLNREQAGQCTVEGEPVTPPPSMCDAYPGTSCGIQYEICTQDHWVSYPHTGQFPSAIAIGDVDNDGTPDILVANKTTSDVTLITGTVDPDTGLYLVSTDETPVKLISLGQEPLDIGLADVDGDGFLDLVGAFSNKISISWGADGSNFETPMYIEKTPDGKKHEPHMVKAADFNEDGRADIIVLSQKKARIYLYVSLGDRTFAGPYEFSSAHEPVDLQLADLNQDGCTDVLVANKGSRTISLLVNEFCGF